VPFNDIKKNDFQKELKTALEKSTYDDLQILHNKAIQVIHEIDNQDKESLSSAEIILKDLEIDGSLIFAGSKVTHFNLSVNNSKIKKNFNIGPIECDADLKKN